MVGRHKNAAGGLEDTVSLPAGPGQRHGTGWRGEG